MTYLDKAKEYCKKENLFEFGEVWHYVLDFARFLDAQAQVNRRECEHEFDDICNKCGEPLCTLDEQAQDSKDGSHICDDDCWTVPGKCMLAPIPKEEKCCAKCYYRDFGDKCKDEDCDCHYKTIADFGEGVPIDKVIEALEKPKQK